MDLDDERISVDSMGSLHINDARLTDSNKYVCRAENGFGSPVIESAFINIRIATKVVKGPTPQAFVMGSNYSLDCIVEVDPRLKETLNVTWLKDNEPVAIEGNDRCVKLGIRREKNTCILILCFFRRRFILHDEGLVIQDMTESDIGVYECAVRTPVDEVKISATIYSDETSWWWLIILLIIICLILICLCCCLVCLVRRRARERGRYGVKDIEDGKKKHNKSDIHYSIDDDTDSIHNELLDSEKEKPIFTPRYARTFKF